MEYDVSINGLDIRARFSTENIEEIFLPLLRHLTDLYERKGKRILVLLAAPPGAGKSTLASFLEYLSKNNDDIRDIEVIGMDGFHYHQTYLLTHSIIRDGEEVNMVKVKGAPETFDLNGLKEHIETLMNNKECLWPIYDRKNHDPIDDALKVDGDIILLEGNYLLLDQDGWRDIRDYADYTIRIDADPSFLKQRLIERHMKGFVSYSHAERFVEYSDLYNARNCLNNSLEADLVLKLHDDDSYSVVR